MRARSIQSIKNVYVATKTHGYNESNPSHWINCIFLVKFRKFSGSKPGIFYSRGVSPGFSILGE